MSQRCNESETKALLISLMPEPIIIRCSLYPQASISDQKTTLFELLEWFTTKFTEGREDDVTIVDKVDDESLTLLFARASGDEVVALSRKQLCV